MEEWDVVVLSETWLDRKGWDSSRGYLLKGYKWEMKLAERKNKKRRAMGGMLVGIRKELKVEEVKVKKRNGLIEVALKVEVENRTGDLEKKLEELNECVERKEEIDSILIGGDFNARTGEEGKIISKEYEEEEGVGRRSKDKRINKEGKELLRWIEKTGWTIFNGCTKGDVEGEWTYTVESGNLKVVGKVEEVWENMRDKIKQVMIGGCVAKGVKRERGWWDSKCKEEKIIVKKELRKSGMGILEIYWGGIEGKVVIGQRAGFRMDEEESISRSEIRAVIGRLKDNKAVGTDGIPEEVWKYGGENVKEWIRKICNRVWKGEGWIEEWNEGMIVPILKKGEEKRVEEYRVLIPTLYKVYASVLAGRLSDEVKEKGLVPQNQTGFRKGLGIMDNIY
ncbi:hypothetical protein ACFW04_012171 [Cataglyphis niger]